MRVLVTGPESSGTRWFTEFIAANGAEALHRSQPEGDDWIDLEAMLDDFDACVVLLRGRHAHCSSLQERLGTFDAEHLRRRALGRIAPVLGDQRVHVVTYESMGSPVERLSILAVLGLGTAEDAVPFDDASAHRYAGKLVPGGWHVEWDGPTPVLAPDPGQP